MDTALSQMISTAPMHPSRSNWLHGSQRAAKLKRLKAKGLLPSQQELARLAADAVATHPITKLKPGKPPAKSPRGHKYDRSGHILRG